MILTFYAMKLIIPLFFDNEHNKIGHPIKEFVSHVYITSDNCHILQKKEKEHFDGRMG